MTKKIKPKVGRPTKEPTAVIAVPVDKIAIVEKMIDKTISSAQSATIRVRVPVDMAEKIKRKIKS